MDWLAALIGAGASLISGISGANAANAASLAQVGAYKHAIDVQQQGTDKALALQKSALAQAHADALPWMTAGKQALAQYQGELGMGAKGFKSKFATTPGYAFDVQQGEKGVVNNMRALGLGGSGAALKELTRFRTGLADRTYQTYLDRLSGQATSGGNVAVGQGSQAMQGAANQGNIITGGANSQAGLYGDLGAATASGYVGGANAISGALGNFSNNIGGYLGQKAGYNNWNLGV